MRSNTASIWPGCSTSSGSSSEASICSASGSTKCFGLFVEIGERDLGAEGAQLDGAAVGDGVGVGDADDEAALALEHLADARVRVPDVGERIDLESLFVHEFSP